VVVGREPRERVVRVVEVHRRLGDLEPMERVDRRRLVDEVGDRLEVA
jgi:hypothetical protein